MNIAIGCDEAAYDLKEILKRHLEAAGALIDDYGVQAGQTALYPDVAVTVARKVAGGEYARAILLCGTGIGVCISANKVPGIRATVAHDPYSVQRSVLSNDCQILTIGARVVGPELAKLLVAGWLDLRFDPGSPSAQKVAAISAYEREA